MCTPFNCNNSSSIKLQLTTADPPAHFALSEGLYLGYPKSLHKHDTFLTLSQIRYQLSDIEELIVYKDAIWPFAAQISFSLLMLFFMMIK